MSNKTLDKELRDILVRGYYRTPEQCIEHIKQAFTNSSWVDYSSLTKDMPQHDRIELLPDMVNEEVVRVLTILETANNHYADGEEALFNNEPHIPLSAIQELKEKYKDILNG